MNVWLTCTTTQILMSCVSRASENGQHSEVQASVGGKERGNHQLGVLPRGVVFLLVAMPGAFVFDADVELHLFSPVLRLWSVMKKGVSVEVSLCD